MSQLERLARPIPAKYVKPPAPGQFGSYVPHYIANQIALAVVGPFTWKIRELIFGADGTTVEGCVGYLKVEIDGTVVEVEEIGDCENPDNWKTNGQRAKDAASDAFKRCWMRESLGLHLRNQETYFLYDQLRQENAEGAGTAPVSLERGPVDAAPSATSPPLGESARNAGVASTSPPAPDAAPAVSKLRRDNLKARCVALTADGVSVADAREELKLPLVDSCNEEQITRFEALVTDLEAALEAPFAEGEISDGSLLGVKS